MQLGMFQYSNINKYVFVVLSNWSQAHNTMKYKYTARVLDG